MKYLPSLLIIAALASQAMIWHSLTTVRDAIQQTNALALAACGSDERPCQVGAHRGQIELGEIMVRTRVSDGFSCGYSRYNPCWIKASGEDGLGPLRRSWFAAQAQAQRSECSLPRPSIEKTTWERAQQKTADRDVGCRSACVRSRPVTGMARQARSARFAVLRG